MTPRELVAGLATAIRAAVAPRLGSGREVVGTTDSGDTTFALDRIAEEAVTAWLADCGTPVRRFTEDEGLSGPVDAEWLVVVDPIDGTRPAKVGLECCCVSVGLARNVPGATLGDIVAAAVYELRADRLFLAERGGGAWIREAGQDAPAPPLVTDHGRAPAGSVELTGRPLVPTAQVLAPFIDAHSLAGGIFMFASTTFALTRLVNGQLDYHIDIADRLRRERPDLMPAILAAGRGHVVSLYVYDLAAAVLIAEEAGVIVTDAAGRSLDHVPLTDVSETWHCSLVAAVSPTLHAAILEQIAAGLAGLPAE